MKLNLTTTSGKVVASVVVMGATAAVAGLGTFGTFTSTTSASAAVSTGSVNIALGAAGTAANRLTVAAADVVPGDTIQRAVQLGEHRHFWSVRCGAHHQGHRHHLERDGRRPGLHELHLQPRRVIGSWTSVPATTTIRC